VVDEVLAVGDAEFQKKAIGKMQDVSKGGGRTVLFVSHNMASIRSLCNTGVLLEKGMVKYIGDINETVNLYLSNSVEFNGQPIIDSFRINDPNLTISDVTVNGLRSNVVDLNWPNRTIEVEVKGYYNGHIPMDLELAFYTENDILVAKKTPSLSTGNTLDVNNSDFYLRQEVELPVGFTNGVYQLRIDITHPKVSYLAQADSAVQLNIDGNFTPMGIPVDQRYFGFVYL
jgi:lipopolysaccharide transport system ATP-binding protein